MVDMVYENPTTVPIPDAIDREFSSRRCPVGVTLVAILMIVGAIFVGGKHAHLVYSVSLEDPNSVTLSGPFKVMLLHDGLFVVTAIPISIALLAGTQWGWWLSAFHWSWRIFRNLYFVLTYGQPDQSLLFKYFTVIAACLILIYLCKRNVLQYCRLGSINRGIAITVILLAGFITNLVLDPLRGPLAMLF
jgi:hypothetical protein